MEPNSMNLFFPFPFFFLSFTLLSLPYCSAHNFYILNEACVGNEQTKNTSEMTDKINFEF